MMLLLLAGVVVAIGVVITWCLLSMSADVDAVSQEWIHTHGREDR